MLVRVLDHDDGGVDHGADGDGNAAEAHDVGAEAEHLHRQERHQNADGQHDDRHQGAADVQEEHDADQRHHQAFLEQRAAQGLDGAIDQLGAVVDRHHLDALGQGGSDLRQSRLDVGDDVERVGAEALQGNAAGDFAFAVEFGDAAPFVGPKLDAGNVLQQHRRAAVDLDHDAFEVGDVLDVASAAHHELVLGKLDRAPADVHVVLADDLAHLGQRNTERAHAAGIDDDVVLLDEAADAGHLGDAFGLCQCEADLPILQRAQFGQRLVLGDDGVLVDPADAGRVGPESRGHPGWQAFAGGVEVFQHPAARPINVGAVLEDHVDE